MIIKRLRPFATITAPFPSWPTKRVNPFISPKNGEGDLVVMSIEAFEEREEILRLRAELGSD